jgi:hypothetical protein
VIHKVAIIAIGAAVKGVIVAGHAIGHALAAQPDVVLAKGAAVPLGHAIAAHPALAALTGVGVLGVPIVTIAYLDVAEAKKQLDAAAGGVTSSRSVKISVAGNFVKGEFNTITGPFRPGSDQVMVAAYDESTQTVTKKIFIQANAVESKIANALSGGNVVVLAA